MDDGNAPHAVFASIGDMRTVPPELLTGPFTVARAAELGVSSKVLRGLQFRSPFPGVRVHVGVPDTLAVHCSAAALLLPDDAVLSHDTGTILRGLPRPWGLADRPLHVSVPASFSAPAITGIVVHRTVWAADDVGSASGLRVMTASRLWCEAAATGWPLVDVVALADHVLRWEGEAGRRRLLSALERWGRRRGAARLRQALGLAALRVDSPMETRLRLLLVDAGLPAAEVNLPIRDAFGEVVHTPDLSWPRWRVAVDYDGGHHFEHDPDGDVAARRRVNWRRRHDIARQENVQAEGWVLRIATAHDLLYAPERLVARIRAALLAAGAPL